MEPQAEPVTPLSATDFASDMAPVGGFPPVVVPNVTVAGKPVLVAKMSAADQGVMYEEIESVPVAHKRAAILAFALRRPDNSRLFQAEGRVYLAQLDGQKAGKISQFFMEMNGLGGN